MLGIADLAGEGNGILRRHESYVDVLKAHGNTDLMQGSAKNLASQLITVMGNTSQAHNEFDAFAQMLGLTKKQADALWASVVKLGQSIDNLHDKTVTITVNTVQTGSGGPHPRGYASGTPAARPGWAWVGEAGPELIKMKGGEQVIPNSVATGYAGGAYDPGVNHIHVHLDGREIYSALQKRAVATQRRTGQNGLTKRTR